MGPPEHPCLAVLAGAEAADVLSFRAYQLGCHGIEVRDADTMTRGASGRVLLLLGFTDGAARDAALATLAAEAPGAEVRPVDVRDDGWSTRWREFFRPVVLKRLQVIAPWMEPPAGDRLTVVIDPGQAFGTGGHPTTRLILSMLEERAAAPGLPHSVLDVGCGSGVLAIAAALLGSGEVLGIDVDPAAVAAAEENARANGVADRVAATDRVLAEAVGSWPLALANIELAVFRETASDIAALVAPGGELLVSGLLEDQREACLALFPGFELRGSATLDGWLALALVRP